ncbi:MAG: PAS domain S-box protein, partial [Bacteroidetes bacterium]|nr:PAS domain S-box protein [Bacteroidota bacterium]
EESVFRFEKILDNSSNGIYTFDANFLKFIQVNKAARNNLGYSMKELADMTPIDLKPEYSKESFEALINPLRTGETERIFFETVHKRKDGTQYPVEVNLQFFPNEFPPTFVSIINDVTERKIAKEKIEEMNKLKTNFLANMSRELRTPLIGIIGYADIIAAEADNEELKEMAKIVKISGERLNETLNCILDLSRIESEQIEKNYEKINVNNFLTDCKNDFEDAASSKGLWINIVANTEPINVVLDKNLLKKITDNILSNAIKYTHKGGIVIKADYDKDKNKVEFVFADTGVGISKENLDLIFDSFRQISEGFNRKFEGSGLGLTVTKKLVELLGGKISVESELGKGSIFKVELPCNGKLNKCDNPAALSELSVPSGRDSSERSSR